MTGAQTQRDRLRARQLPTKSVLLPADPVAHAAAEEEFTAALLAAQQAGRGAAAKAAQERVLAAKAALDEQHAEMFVIRTLPAPEWEALRHMHAPTEEQAAKGWDWNTETLRPELLAAAVVPPEGETAYTAAEWVEFARDGRVSSGEQDLLFMTAVGLTRRAVQVATGKG